MERRTRLWAACGLLMLLAATGCRSMHSNVPPGPKFSADGRQQPPIGFSNESHPPNQFANPALNSVNNMNMAPGGNLANMGGVQTGMPGSAVNNYGVPGGAAFGAPGTSGADPSLGAGGGSLPGASAGGVGGLGSASGIPGSN